MRSIGDYKDVNLKILVEEAAQLEWINNALAKQMNMNANRLAEIDKILAAQVEEEMVAKASARRIT